MSEYMNFNFYICIKCKHGFTEINFIENVICVYNFYKIALLTSRISFSYGKNTGSEYVV